MPAPAHVPGPTVNARERIAGRFENRFRDLGGEWEDARVVYAYEAKDLGRGTIWWRSSGFYVHRPSATSTSKYWQWLGAYHMGASLRVNKECRKAMGIDPPTFAEVMEVASTVLKIVGAAVPLVKSITGKDS